MNKTCLKCGTSSEVEMTAFTACPKCGAVYSKVEQAEEFRKATEALRAARAAAVPPLPSLDVVQEESRPAPPAPKPVAPGMLGRLVRGAAWAGVIVGALFGFLQIALTSSQAQGAPQQAAGMAMALAYAVVPYVLARAIQELTR